MRDPTSRRAFTLGVGVLSARLGVGGLSRVAEAQPSAARRSIGVLLVLLSSEDKEAQAFRQWLRNAGYVEGRDVVIEWRSASGARAAQRATSIIPIVMAIVADPVGDGLGASENDWPPFFTHRTTLLRLAAKAPLAVVSGERAYADEGGVMSYGPSYEDQLRRSADYVDKILRRAQPGGLPIEQPAKFTLIVNLKTARLLGITISESIMLRTDEVIQ